MKANNNRKKSIAAFIANFLGIVGLCTGFFTMFITFMMVYFGIWCCIDINAYGEANFEFVLLLILLPFVIYTIYYHFETMIIEK